MSNDNNSSNNNGKLVIIGLDGATFNLILPWIKEGKLPVLTKLIKEGAWGNLKSTIPMNTAPAWSSFCTGKNPGKHGIFDFCYHTEDNYNTRFINGLRRRGKSLWRILSEHGKKVVVFNVPVTYPPEEVNGCMISGLTAPDVNEKIFYPRELFKEIFSKVGTFAIKPFPKDQIRLNRFDRIFEEMDSVVDNHFKVADHLFQNKDWDFFCMVFGTTDSSQHFFWQHMDPTHPFYNPSDGAVYGESIYKIYQKVDGMIGSMMERLGENDTILIMSDHGAGANSNKAIYLNNWLAREGFLNYKGNTSANNIKANLLKSSIFFAKKHIPRKYKNKIRSLFPQLKSRVETIYWDSRIDWPRTKAFSIDNNGLIWINLEGREAEGAVREGQEYEDLRTKIIEKALDFTDPETGEKIFSQALRREELYHGDALDHAPDVILVQKERQHTYFYRNSTLATNKTPIEKITLETARKDTVQMASHRMNGIAIIKGPSVQSDKNFPDAKIIDIAPTVLYLMGTPIPEDMDGKVITEAIDPSSLSTNPIRYSEADTSAVPETRETEYTESEEKKIEETLKSLGYID